MSEDRLMWMVSVYDAALDTYAAPASCYTERDAIRSFGMAVRDANNLQIRSQPADFALFVLGYFNPHTGELKPCQPRRIVRAVDCLEGEQATLPVV